MTKAIYVFFIGLINSFFTNWVEDFLFGSGVIVILINTYLITIIDLNFLVGNYLLGILLIIFGVSMARR